MRKISFVLFFVFLFISLFQLKAQERAILVPKPITGSPFQVDDSDDLFGTAYRWFLEGEYELGLDSLKKLIKASGFQILPGNYYVVMANFTDSFSPIGLIHEDDDFFSTRMYGLKENNLYYIYISRQREGKSFLSVLVTAKDSPFMENLPLFIGIFQPLVSIDAQVLSGETTWIDIRQFNVPVPFRKFSDLSFIIKPSLSEEKILAKTVFDNTSKERWSYGIASAITTAKDVDIIVGADGKITGVIEHVKDITERVQAEQDIKTLMGISRQASSETSLDDLLFFVANEIVGVIPPAEAPPIASMTTLFLGIKLSGIFSTWPFFALSQRSNTSKR